MTPDTPEAVGHTLKLTIRANTATDLLNAIRAHYRQEGPRLQRFAALTTGRARKDREAQATYASTQADFWESVTVEPRPTLSSEDMAN